ncbi:ABC transporter [Streptomyces sp. MBT62]|uniref:ABC transporter n=1 Tax=Streptomyces sp. MBT62 TaxID=2800410 RepID=UPI0027DBEB9C|nr:ABC transporter [Streptomyces sp. MBT62]
MRVTPGLLGQLARPVLRALPRRALGAGAAAGLLLAALPRLTSADFDPRSATLLLRGAVLAFTLGLTFLLDDPARQVTAAVPTRRILRTALRTALVAPLAALWWTAVVLLIPAQARPPIGDITLEAAAAVVVALAASAASIRLTDEAEPGQRLAIALLATSMAAALLLPAEWGLFALPKDKWWAAGHDHWAFVLAGAVLVWAASGPEPVRRRRLRLTASRLGPSRLTPS